MLIIAGINQKGGVGKTMLILNIAGAAHAEGKKTLVIDLDPQGSASAWAGRRAHTVKPDANGDMLTFKVHKCNVDDPLSQKAA